MLNSGSYDGIAVQLLQTEPSRDEAVVTALISVSCPVIPDTNAVVFLTITLHKIRPTDVTGAEITRQLANTLALRGKSGDHIQFIIGPTFDSTPSPRVYVWRCNPGFIMTGVRYSPEESKIGMVDVTAK